MNFESINDLKKFMNRVDFIGPVYFGSSNDQTGQINFYNSSSQYATTFQAGNATAAVTYTWPTGAPGGNNYLLAGATTGVLSWLNAPATYAPIGSAFVTIGSDATLTSERALTGTANQITVTDNGAGSTAVLSFPTTVDITTISHTGGTKIKGTNTNDSAAAGDIGEYIESVVSSAANIPGTTVWGDATSISLTAGDWEVSAVLSVAAAGATMTVLQMGISSTTGNSTTGLVVGSNQINCLLPVNGVALGGGSLPAYRVSLSGTTTYYLKIEGTYTTATPQSTCRLSARRMR